MVTQAELRGAVSRTALVQKAEVSRQQDVQQREYETKLAEYNKQVAIQKEAQAKYDAEIQARASVMRAYEKGMLWAISAYGSGRKRQIAKEMMKAGYSGAKGGLLEQEQRKEYVTWKLDLQKRAKELSLTVPELKKYEKEGMIFSEPKPSQPELRGMGFKPGDVVTQTTRAGEVSYEAPRVVEVPKQSAQKFPPAPTTPFQVMAEEYQQKQLDMRQSIRPKKSFWYDPSQQKTYTPEESAEYLKTTTPIKEIFRPTHYPYWVGRATTKLGEEFVKVTERVSPELKAFGQAKIDTEKYPYVVPAAKFVKGIGDYALLGTFFGPAMAFGKAGTKTKQVQTTKTKKDGTVYVRKFEDLFKKKKGEEEVLKKIREISRRIVEEPDASIRITKSRGLSDLVKTLRERGLIKPEMTVLIDEVTGGVTMVPKGFLAPPSSSFFPPIKTSWTGPTSKGAAYFTPPKGGPSFTYSIGKGFKSIGPIGAETTGAMVGAGTITGVLGTQLPKQPSKEKEKVISRPITGGVTIIKTTPTTKPISLSIPKAIPRTAVSPATITLTAPKAPTIPKQIPKQIPRTIKLPKLSIPKGFLPIIFGEEQKKLKQRKLIGELFEAYGRRRGIDLSLGEFGTKEQAKKKLLGFLSGTLGAGGYITKAGKKLRFEEIGLGLKEFRPAKYDAFRVIQRRGYRLGTYPERKEIKGAKRRASKVRWW